MLKYVVKRLFGAIPVFIGVAIIAFSLTHLSGDPVMLMVSMDTPPEQIEQIRQQMGYDLPIYIQFKDYMLSLLRLDLGSSIRYQEPVAQLIMERFPATLQLATASLVLALLIGIPIGIISAVKKNSISDYVVSVFSLFGQSVAPFWFGLMLILLFSVVLNWLPASGKGSLEQLIMPTLTLGLFFTASVARLTRSGMLEIMQSDYIRTARAKGLDKQMVIGKHALKNSLIPVITMVGIEFGGLLGGAVVTEMIFSWPGLGRMIIQAIYNRDYPLVQGAMLFIATGFILINIAVDIIYRFLDPRIKHT
jgi:peptide/nickel transport system permease protein